ncbi:MAG: phage capsid protein [Psychrobacillus sp.]
MEIKKQELFIQLPSLQFFAAGDNNDQPVRIYQKQFVELMTAVFRKQAYFGRFFTGGLQALDGVANNATAFTVKTSDIPVVVGTYDTDPNVAFGTGTANTTRFGERTEVIYVDTDVKYTWDWAFHEGIDRHTVNNNFEAAIADRLDLQAQAKINQFNRHHGKFISDNAGKTEALTAYTNDEVLALFNRLAAYYINIEAVGNKVAVVTPALYNAIVDHPLMTTGKNSRTNIDDNEVFRFKGFEIQEMPDALAQTGEIAYVYIEGIAKAFTGINTTRTIESEDFDGVALQGAGKAGEFIPNDNKKAVVKVTGPAVTPEG